MHVKTHTSVGPGLPFFCTTSLTCGAASITRLLTRSTFGQGLAQPDGSKYEPRIPYHIRESSLIVSIQLERPRWASTAAQGNPMHVPMLAWQIPLWLIGQSPHLVHCGFGKTSHQFRPNFHSLSCVSDRSVQRRLKGYARPSSLLCMLNSSSTKVILILRTSAVAFGHGRRGVARLLASLRSVERGALQKCSCAQ
ncbi:hypothetical protein F5148DRAFT_941355 [Russula earlei]|uniref:Uncharacterized protein n=1 Tax=Russula earlei TaxID=71964 RepID=A0ACC0U9E7_9AGAM|nr:hypothetical protein F5148DRAFT_941355 [Russula earlei]